MEFKSMILAFSLKEKIILLIAFFLPVLPKLVPLLIIALTLFWIFEKGVIVRFKNFFSNKYALLFSGLYFIHIIGLLYSSNLSFGFFDLEVKLSILLFPLILSSIYLGSLNQKVILKAFILGCFSIAVICILKATYLYIMYGVKYFFYNDLSLTLHPSYFALYINLAITALLIWCFDKNESTKGRINLYYFLLIFFIVFIVLLSSKMGIMVLGLNLLLTLGYFVFRKSVTIKAISLLVLSFGIFYLSYNKLVINDYKRLSKLANNSMVETVSNEPASTTESSQVRILIWTRASELIRDNWLLGVGTGDIKDVLVKSYIENDMTGAAEKKLNVHNQFLQTFLALGIIGFLVLIINFLFPFFESYKRKNFIYSILLIILAINFLVESMLETQTGVVFFAFFNSVFMFIPFNSPLRQKSL